MQAEQEEESILDKKSLLRRKNNHNSLFCKVLEKIQVDTGLRIMYTKFCYPSPFQLKNMKYTHSVVKRHPGSCLRRGLSFGMLPLHLRICLTPNVGSLTASCHAYQLAWRLSFLGTSVGPRRQTGPQHQGGACIPEKPRLSKNVW